MALTKWPRRNVFIWMVFIVVRVCISRRLQGTIGVNLTAQEARGWRLRGSSLRRGNSIRSWASGIRVSAPSQRAGEARATTGIGFVICYQKQARCLCSLFGRQRQECPCSLLSYLRANTSMPAPRLCRRDRRDWRLGWRILASCLRFLRRRPWRVRSPRRGEFLRNGPVP